MTAALRHLVLPLTLLLLLAAPARADNLKIAKDVIGRQVGLIKAGNVAKLKAGFTERLRERITQENVKRAQKEIGSIALDELVAEVGSGTTSFKIKMKNGRSLTTLVKVDGKWLADTLWYK